MGTLERSCYERCYEGRSLRSSQSVLVVRGNRFLRSRKKPKQPRLRFSIEVGKESQDAFRATLSNTTYRCGFKKRIPKGGSVRSKENGWPCAGTLSASTPPAFP
jgi:hypothetical protein